jgi:hypothetical protein
MTDLRDAARQALEALESTQLFAAHEHYPRRRVADALDALSAALEQPEQEVKGCDHCNHPLYAAIKCHACGRVTEQEQKPAAWIQPDHLQKAKQAPFLCRVEPTQRWADFVPFYTHPPRREWRGLKEWEINDGLDQLPTEDVCSWSFRKGVYFAEAALKERNI